VPTHNPLPLEKLRALRKPVRQVNLEHRERLSKLDKLALMVTVRVGTMGFFLIILAWTVLWLGWNMVAPPQLRFDPYPAFVFWLFISNLIQILLMPLIMVGQNLQGRHSEARAEGDFEVDSQSARELEVILQHLENQNELLAKVLSYLEQGKK
jgi:uncharacterized membrane protein